jgi:hypothetical protein
VWSTLIVMAFLGGAGLVGTAWAIRHSG